jgi:tetratricopeptide (TPR) repeat protein
LGIERRSAADILWPGRSPENLANLRQSLSILRRALPESAIESSVYHCRLGSAVDIVSDYEHPELRSGGFMPGHDGDWFEELRGEAETAMAEEPTMSSHFLEMLQWLARRDPRGMYAMLQTKPPMSLGIPYKEMLGLLDVAKESAGSRGWYSYWRGTAENNLQDCARLLRVALRESRQSNDMELASETCFELGKVYSRTGNFTKALRVCDIADEVALRSKSDSAKTNALRLRGTILINWNDLARGHELLLQAEQGLNDPIRLASIQGVRAFFEASAGWYERAEATHAQSLSLVEDSGHFRIGVVSSMTLLILQAARGKRSDAMRSLEQRTQEFYASGVTQFGVYADE